MSDYPPIIIVNDKDEPVGEASMQEAHDEGLIHRVVWVIAEDEAGKVLLQKRGPNVVTYPGRWDFSAAGHVDAGEDYDAAAYREMEEELGLSGNYELKELEYYYDEEIYEGRKLNRFIKLFKVVVPIGIEIIPEANEITAVKWLDRDGIVKMLTSSEKVTPDFRVRLEKYYLSQP
jgi:isopentenyldiphosphate isomerase